ncbi:hypothetical protein CVCC1112_1001 [Paenarthrobacter nicotinovorans]|nr:hypothetical protein CVCC1112_1001 [Paenarthrobacter nicotinovorans]
MTLFQPQLAEESCHSPRIPFVCSRPPVASEPSGRCRQPYNPQYPRTAAEFSVPKTIPRAPRPAKETRDRAIHWL